MANIIRYPKPRFIYPYDSKIFKIVNKSKKYYEIHDMFNSCITDFSLIINIKHSEFRVPEILDNNKLYGLYTFYDVFINYFIRRCFSEKLNIPFKDNKFMSTFLHCNSIKKSIRYVELFNTIENTKNNTFDILDDIVEYLSYFYFTFFPTKNLSKFNYDLNFLKEIHKWVNSFEVKNHILLNPDLETQHLKPDLDIIYGDVIIDFKLVTSDIELSDIHVQFYKHILYAYAYYKKYNIKLNKFIIYKPFSGKEYCFELKKDIDFNLIESLLNKYFK